MRGGATPWPTMMARPREATRYVNTSPDDGGW